MRTLPGGVVPAGAEVVAGSSSSAIQLAWPGAGVEHAARVV
ncbi:MAG TPA: hypothetical protein VN845_08320 [Solirubrobacteraceae bacterium]|nr:hypothetical protein [Solirubrobacteraceae bacterium]